MYFRDMGNGNSPVPSRPDKRGSTLFKTGKGLLQGTSNISTIYQRHTIF